MAAAAWRAPEYDFESSSDTEYLRLKPPFSGGYWGPKPDRTGNVAMLRSGNHGSQLYYLYRYQDKALEVSQLPQWQVEDFDASIEQGNFELLRLEWMSPDDRTPDYVLPEDIYYKVVFCDRKWHDRHLFYPHMMDVYIVEKTREVFRLTSDYDWARWYDKSKP